MPPLPKNPGPLFTQHEIGLGGGLTRREVVSLKEADPDFVPPGHGCRAVKRVAAIGALRSAGLSLISAARVFIAIRETDLGTREVSSQFEYIAGRLAWEILANAPPEASDDNDYYLHQDLYRRDPSPYVMGAAVGHDYMVEIVDWHAVLSYTPRLAKPSLIGWINHPTGRGVDVAITTPRYDARTEDELRAQAMQAKARDEKAAADRANAVSRVILNLSLAVRNAFDRIEMSRSPPSTKATTSRRNPEDGHE